ncbi:MAG: hypothetical protein ACOX6W_03220 [Lentisphaeria bacterium]
MYRDEENIRKLNVVGGFGGKKPVAVRIELAGIYDFDGRELVDTEFTVPLHPIFKPGYLSLPPPMFSNAKGAYTQITLSDDQKELFVVAPSTENPGVRMQDTLEAGAEQGKEPHEDIEYYGVWYRDLDGDGRIDAVDLRFKNPYIHTSTQYAQVCMSAVRRFHVYGFMSRIMTRKTLSIVPIRRGCPGRTTSPSGTLIRWRLRKIGLLSTIFTDRHCRPILPPIGT